MEIINTFKQNIAKIFDGTTSSSVAKHKLYATDEDGCAVENFCNTLFKCKKKQIYFQKRNLSMPTWNLLYTKLYSYKL